VGNEALPGQCRVLVLAKSEERDDEDDEKDSSISSARHLDFLILLAKRAK
jgi:hypothetical protein